MSGFDAEASLAAAVVSYNRADREREIARKALHSAFEVAERARAGRRPHAVCGTPGGYQRHQLDGTEADAACLEAHARDTQRVRLVAQARARHRDRRRAG